MTDQDNLRDRIAKVIEPGDWRVRESCALPLGHPGRDAVVRASRERAQAIIDELGLTTETHAATHAKRNMTRITGAWEWEKQ